MENKTHHLKIVFTSDIHGNYFPYDFRHERWGKGSLQRVYGYVSFLRKRYADKMILIDGGDIIQGEPTSYYFNYIDKSEGHKVADICNYIGYDACVIGNHDIETGHDNFDRFVSNCHFPVLAANAIHQPTGKPYFRPYTIIERNELRIALIGFITPAIPHWIPKNVWRDLLFLDIKESASYWVEKVRREESPDLVVGVIHSGLENGIVTPSYKENAVKETASEVPGFDLILYGHDHASNMEDVYCVDGGSVLCVNPGSYAYSVALVDIKVTKGAGREILHKDISCQLIYIGSLHNQYTHQFRKQFEKEFNNILHFSSEKLGVMTEKVDVKDAYFGSSAYIDLIHTLQHHVSGAQLSFAAPLFFNASIESGDLKINNLFNLYRFEDRLYTLRLTGKEIKDYLEMSYSTWICQMHSADDPFLLTEPMKNNPSRIGFKNFLFNFDCASGILYEVDVRKGTGERVHIISMSDGKPFSLTDNYTVAMTAYRANGGGELLTKGAGLTKDDIERRTVRTTEKDIRYYLMEYIKEKHVITPTARHTWRFIPEDWVAAATIRERELLFGQANSPYSSSENDKRDR